MTRVSRLAASIEASATLALTGKANALKAAGRPVISFAAGEPDFISPEPVLDAARRAIAEGRTKYSPAPGLPELRDAVVEDVKRRYGVERERDEVIISNGAKHSLYNLLLALVDPGEGVVFAAPYWVSYPWLVRLVGGRPIVLETRSEDNFRLDPELVIKTLDLEKPRVLLLNSPQNPTGAVYAAEDIDAIVAACVERGVTVISDEIYEELVFGEAKHRSALAVDSPAHREHVIYVSGVSKSLAMTGWRIGYAVGPKAVIAAATRVQSHSTSGPCTISQLAALGGLREGASAIASMRESFAERSREIARLLGAIDGVRLAPPLGAFYAFPNIDHFCRGKLGGTPVSSDMELAAALLDQAEIAAVPGTAFGSPGHLRLSFALGLDELREGIGRMAKAFEDWEPA